MKAERGEEGAEGKPEAGRGRFTRLKEEAASMTKKYKVKQQMLM